MKAMLLPGWLQYGLALTLLLAAFALRFEHLLARVFHIDEYISMLAALMTVEKGAPIFPSGLLYNQGLLASYLAAPFLGVLGFTEEIARWPSLLMGVLTVAGFYLVGARLLKSHTAGLFALTFAALDASMILWSARMRMYALAALLMLLALYFLVQGTFLRPQPRYRLAALVCYLGAILSHAVSVVALPAWALAALLVMWLGRQTLDLSWRRRPSSRSGLEVLVVILLGLAAFGYVVLRQIPFLSPGDEGGGAGGVMQVFQKFVEPGVSWQRIDDFVYYYVSPNYWPLIVLGGLALLMALVSLLRGQLTRRDLVTLFLGLAFCLTIAELSVVLAHTWRKTRYLFILCQAPFLLLAADGLARLAGLLSAFVAHRARWVPQAVVLLGVAGIIASGARPALDVAGMQGTGGYDTAFMWVKERWQTGDRIMTVHPSASYLYLNRSDYYATQSTARVLIDDESEEPVDRYVGSQLLDSIEALNRVLSEPGRLWFVVDTSRLFGRYDPLFIQQIFAQMDVVYRASGVLVFVSRPFPRPVPAKPAVPFGAGFGDLVQLGGYSLDLDGIAPDGTLQLVLYWRPLGGQFTRVYKVFVQLRNQDDQIVAQADHFIFEGFLTGSIIEQLGREDEWLRDTADLTLPRGLPPGTYRLLVGLYDPDTLERVPVAADQSGENAVLLETVSVP
jgi:4-amino-4-deoxy-L-arabinose transferase-like glycosyltransferase